MPTDRDIALVRAGWKAGRKEPYVADEGMSPSYVQAAAIAATVPEFLTTPECALAHPLDHVCPTCRRRYGLSDELAALRRDAERFYWWFSDTPKPQSFINEFLKGIREHWTIDQWRTAIDAAMATSTSADD